MEEIWDLIGDLVADGWTYEALATRLEVHPATLYRWVQRRTEPPVKPAVRYFLAHLLQETAPQRNPGGRRPNPAGVGARPIGDS